MILIENCHLKSYLQMKKMSKSKMINHQGARVIFAGFAIGKRKRKTNRILIKKYKKERKAILRFVRFFELIV